VKARAFVFLVSYSVPNLYVGAGKTTESYTILPEILNCREFVNADEIAKGLSPFQPETVAFEAGRIMLKRMRELMAQQGTLRNDAVDAELRSALEEGTGKRVSRYTRFFLAQFQQASTGASKT